MPLFLLAQNGCNCCSEKYREFDFWLGSWTVANTDGSPAGTNEITKEEDKCVVREKWTSANNGFTGTSVNFFNTKTSQWEQLWVDNSGNHLKLKGNRFKNQMILSSEPFEHTDGKLYVNRITWTKNLDGTVRQLWELLQGEEVNSVLFDGLYSKKKE